MHLVTSSFFFLVVVPGATSSFLFLVGIVLHLYSSNALATSSF